MRFGECNVGSPRRLGRACTNQDRQVAMAIKFLMVMPNICWSSVWNVFLVNPLGSRILRWLLDFGKFMHPLFRVTENSCKKFNQV